MTTHDYRRVIDPTKLPKDEAAIARDAERVRKAEVRALLEERRETLDRLELKRRENLSERFDIVDEHGNVLPLKIVRVPVREVRAEHDAVVSRLEREIAGIDDELAARGHVD